ncbi:unnamed protein product [Cochlearia groenlandica]
MDVYEATRIVLSRIQSLDPTNASKIMGLLLLQDHEDKEMIRLAFGPQNLLHSVITKAKTELGLMVSDDMVWGQCSYFVRGFCKNGDNCKFLHGGSHETLHGFDSPVTEKSNELLRSKSIPPRLSHQLTGGSRFPFSPKGVNFQQSEAQRAAALMMGDDLGRWRTNKVDFLAMACPASRQIYLTFPADSIFREEDVSNYFSTYGPVQDVRIPYQQKRMFGFVTFMYPETVKNILAKGNPHFVCDSRVLVKPYKEKGKVPDKYRSKPSLDGTLTGLDSRDIMDLQLGGRSFHDNNTQELLWKRRFEEQNLELQSRRLMNLQFLDVKKHFQFGSSNPFDQTLVSPRIGSFFFASYINQKVCAEDNDEDTIKLPESLEDSLLPDSPFASPTHHFLEFDESVAVATSADSNGGSGSSSPSFDSDEMTTTLSESFKSVNCEMPSLALIREGPTCPVSI